ncbi:MAG: type IV toxin-antitoxin system AbiEi family antitoxin domain-containing protein [Chlorobium sp.]
MKIEQKLKTFGSVPLTHGILLSLLAEYRSPNDKIVRLMHEGWLVAVKRGLYVVSPELTSIPVSLPLVANHLYGPSCVSMDYALSHYGIIPDRVFDVTSMTIRRSKRYDLQLGRFSYTHSDQKLYSVGIDRVVNADKTTFMIASPEKALCDKLLFTRNLNSVTSRDLQALLFEDLRVDDEQFARFDPQVIEASLQGGYKVKLLQTLLHLLKSMKSRRIG